MKTRVISKGHSLLFLFILSTTISYGQKLVEQFNANGLSTNVFNLTSGKITVYLPFHREGETISGTTHIEPLGESKEQKNKNLSKIQDYHLIMGEVSVSVKTRIFTFRSMTFINTPIQLLNEKGTEIARSYFIKEGRQRPKEKSTYIPSYVVSGQPGKILTNADGDLTNNSIKVNNIDAPILAGSESELFFETPPLKVGQGELRFTNNGDQNVMNVHVLQLELFFEKTELFRGQSTNLSIIVKGLKNIKDKIPLSITNLTPRNVSLEGGNFQNILIDPERDTSSGKFRLSRSIKAKQNGGFLISVHIDQPEISTLISTD